MELKLLFEDGLVKISCNLDNDVHEVPEILVEDAVVRIFSAILINEKLIEQQIQKEIEFLTNPTLSMKE